MTVNLAEIRAAHPDEITVVGALLAEIVQLRKAAAAVDTEHRAILNQLVRGLELPARVAEWEPDEQAYFRDGDWDLPDFSKTLIGRRVERAAAELRR